MKRRVVTVVLWFYVVWYAAAMVAGTLGLPPAIGPIAGAIAATVVAVVLRRAAHSAPMSGIPAGDAVVRVETAAQRAS